VLEVREPGLLTTVQDGVGRPDAASLGVPRGGAADPYGLTIANLLLGNDANAAALEMTMTGPELTALESCLVGLGGADLGAEVVRGGESRRLAVNASHRLEAGDVLRFDGADAGAGIRGYLSLPGGIDVPGVLGSAATCLPGGFGGRDGRALRSGDRIGGKRRDVNLRESRWAGPPIAESDVRRVRVVRGPHATDEWLAAFTGAGWVVSPTSSRAGIRLTGASIPAGGGRLTSLPMVWGAVQIPPGGEPIILLVDAPTIGGYPVVAVVASADRSLIGQLGPADSVAFDLITEDEARVAELARRSLLEEYAARL
jgi:biotin-dependent carboxylase-like uncharacterized protein